MYRIIKNVIDQGNFELSDMLNKIDTFWIKGNTTEEQRTELIELAQSKAKPQNSIDIMQKLEEMDQRIKTLEDMLKNANTETPDPEEETLVEYPEFVLGKWYYTDDNIAFEGKKYTCVAPKGIPCVWSPKDYPTYWQLVE